jgi:hypothetical protein
MSSYHIETRNGPRAYVVDNYQPGVEIHSGFADIQGPNGLTYVCVVDDIFLRSEGELGRVDISRSIDLLSSMLEKMDPSKLQRFINDVSEERGIHSGRLQLTLKYGHATSYELAWEVFAHHCDLGQESLRGLLNGNIFSNISKNQASGLQERLRRTNRLEIINNGLFKGFRQGETHLLSNRKILMIK